MGFTDCHFDFVNCDCWHEQRQKDFKSISLKYFNVSRHFRHFPYFMLYPANTLIISYSYETSVHHLGSEKELNLQ